MPDYTNTWYKHIVVSRVRTVVVGGLNWVEDDNVLVHPGEALALSAADAATMGDHITYKTVLSGMPSETVALGELIGTWKSKLTLTAFTEPVTVTDTPTVIKP